MTGVPRELLEQHNRLVELFARERLPHIGANVWRNQRRGSRDLAFEPIVFRRGQRAPLEHLQIQVEEIPVGHRTAKQHVLLRVPEDWKVRERERAVLVPRKQPMAAGAGVAIEIEVVHRERSEDAILLGQEVLDRHMRDELPQIDVLLDPIPPDPVLGVVDLAKQIANRRVENRIRLELVILRLEPELVLAQVIAEVVAVEALPAAGTRTDIRHSRQAFARESRCRPLRRWYRRHGRRC